MIWIIISAILTACFSIWLGYRRLFYLYQVTIRKLLFYSIIVLLVYSLMLYLFKLEILSEAVAGAIITNVYASIFGFFIGSTIDQYSTRIDSGNILYCHRSFISDYVPVIVALSMILFGVYRSAIFSDLALTAIRLSSGLSFIAFGLWGITLRAVPEFRTQGIVLLDLIIDWDDMLSYEWFTEEILLIEYSQDDLIRSFKTIIPPEDQVEVERLLSKIMREKVEKED